MAYITVSVSAEVDTDVEVDVDDVLSQMSDDELIDYVCDEIDNDTLRERLNLENELSYFSSDEIIEYLYEEHMRGAFSDIDFKKLFDKLGLNVN